VYISLRWYRCNSLHLQLIILGPAIALQLIVLIIVGTTPIHAMICNALHVIHRTLSTLSISNNLAINFHHADLLHTKMDDCIAERCITSPSENSLYALEKVQV